MTELRLRRMTDLEFEAFRGRTIGNYSAAHVEAGGCAAAVAATLAAEQTDQLLPKGAETPGMLLLVAETDAGVPVGGAGCALEHPEYGCAWVYAVDIVPEQRGMGYGRALLAAVEAEATRHGAHAIGLQVFGSNLVARSLYESAGYRTLAVRLRKELPRDAGNVDGGSPA